VCEIKRVPLFECEGVNTSLAWRIRKTVVKQEREKRSKSNKLYTTSKYTSISPTCELQTHVHTQGHTNTQTHCTQPHTYKHTHTNTHKRQPDLKCPPKVFDLLIPYMTCQTAGCSHAPHHTYVNKRVQSLMSIIGM